MLRMNYDRCRCSRRRAVRINVYKYNIKEREIAHGNTKRTGR